MVRRARRSSLSEKTGYLKNLKPGSNQAGSTTLPSLAASKSKNESPALKSVMVGRESAGCEEKGFVYVMVK